MIGAKTLTLAHDRSGQLRAQRKPSAELNRHEAELTKGGEIGDGKNQRFDAVDALPQRRNRGHWPTGTSKVDQGDGGHRHDPGILLFGRGGTG